MKMADDSKSTDRKLTAEEIHEIAIAPIKLDFNIIPGKSYGCGKKIYNPVSEASLITASQTSLKSYY